MKNAQKLMAICLALALCFSFLSAAALAEGPADAPPPGEAGTPGGDPEEAAAPSTEEDAEPPLPDAEGPDLPEAAEPDEAPDGQDSDPTDEEAEAPAGEAPLPDDPDGAEDAEAETLPSDGTEAGEEPLAADGAPGDSSSSSVVYGGATEITAAATQSGKTYASTTADRSALYIYTSANVVINDPTVTKTGSSNGGDNCNFYGQNASVLCRGGGTTYITGGSVTSNAEGANGVFSYGGNGGQNGAAGDGTTVVIKNTVIETSGGGSGGIMTTGGGVTYAENLTITTHGQSSAPIRTDRGGGTVVVDGGTYTANGLGSPVIYSTADITAKNATLISTQSEGVCIEGKNSITLENCDFTVNNRSMNGNATFLDSIMIYQSMSGDADSGTSRFSMTGGSLTSQSGHVFHVTNTNAVITLSGVDIRNTDSGNVLISVCDDGWTGNSGGGGTPPGGSGGGPGGTPPGGSGGGPGGTPPGGGGGNSSGGDNTATLIASGQALAGAVLVGSSDQAKSTLTMDLTDGSSFTGYVDGHITNAKGTVVSTSVGTVNVTLDASSVWHLTGDSYITSLSTPGVTDYGNIDLDGHTLYVNGTAVTETGYVGDAHFTVTFPAADHFAVNVFYDPDAAVPDETGVTSAAARTDGKYDVSGSGSVIFELVLAKGCAAEDIRVFAGGTELMPQGGRYTLSHIAGDAAVTVTMAFAAGDMNGDYRVDSADLLRLLQYVSGQEVTLCVSGNVTGDADGRIDTADLLRLLKYLTGQPVALHRG